MADVRIGFFSFTEITDPTEHRSYNEWHQLDHMPEQYSLAGLVFGQRWVSTPACRRARAYDDPSLAPIHYMTLYLMGEPVDTTLEEFRALGQRLHAEGRFHEHRRARLSGPFVVTGMSAAPRVLVSPPAIPFRPNRGVYVVVHDRTGSGDAGIPGPGRGPGTTPSAADGGDAQPAASLLETEGVAGTWTFATHGRFDDHGWRPGDKTITVAYLDVEPLTVAPRLGDLVRAGALGSHSATLFAGPFETVTPWCWDWFDDEP
jgi:hypothetical protein